jgi:hypothetical protein
MAVPAETPLTIPEPEPMVAMDVAVVLHAPPASASLSVVVAPAHNVAVPVIADGLGLIVIVALLAISPEHEVLRLVAETV